MRVARYHSLGTHHSRALVRAEVIVGEARRAASQDRETSNC